MNSSACLGPHVALRAAAGDTGRKLRELRKLINARTHRRHAGGGLDRRPGGAPVRARVLPVGASVNRPQPVPSHGEPSASYLTMFSPDLAGGPRPGPKAAPNRQHRCDLQQAPRREHPRRALPSGDEIVEALENPIFFFRRESVVEESPLGAEWGGRARIFRKFGGDRCEGDAE